MSQFYYDRHSTILLFCTTILQAILADLLMITSSLHFICQVVYNMYTVDGAVKFS
jgi:hypothetical protein